MSSRDPQTLDYRRPTTPAAGTGDLLRQLKLRDATSTGKAVGLVLLGLAILLVMITFTSWVTAVILFQLGLWPGAWQTWALTAAVLVPALFWTEWRTRGRFFDDASDGFGGGANAASSYGEYQIDRFHASVAGFSEFLLTGPRFVLEGLGARQRRGRVDDALLERAAEVLRLLLEANQGLTLKQMLRPGEESAALRAALSYLAAHDWIGTSRDGSRAWLLSDARERLR